MIRVEIDAGARQDVREIVQHYKSIRPELALQFIGRLRASIALIRLHPEAFPARELGVRWALLRQFPFKLFFVLMEDGVRILAVLHAHARPDEWKSRVG